MHRGHIRQPSLLDLRVLGVVMKTIGYYEAMGGCESGVSVFWNEECAQGFQVHEDFVLISVPGGSNGTHGKAGDWVVLAPDQYPQW